MQQQHPSHFVIERLGQALAAVEAMLEQEQQKTAHLQALLDAPEVPAK